MSRVPGHRISAGLRVGFWNPVGGHHSRAFNAIGYYCGPDIGVHLPGAKLEQQLDEGVLKFRVGVLFRPDMNVKQRMETILILEKYIPEMFNYDTWDREGLATAEL